MPHVTLWVAIHPEHHALAQAVLGDRPYVRLVEGGASRQQSVLNALEAVYVASQHGECEAVQWVMVHDAARPLVDASLVQRVWDARHDAPCVVPACSVHDTLKMVAGDAVTGTLNRNEVRAVQTPQLADFQQLLSAHRVHVSSEFTDDAALMEAAGHKVAWVDGAMQNIKITTPEDVQRAQHILHAPMSPRVGMGYDVHPLVPHEPHIPSEQQVITLGGIAIPFEMRCKGHSDADVILHAVVDALLGAIGEGDIGQHFPPSDMRWKDADSTVFVDEAMRLVKLKGGIVENLDVTYIGEVPRIGAYREAIQARIAQLLEVAPMRVNIKATTTEKLGFEGRKEGVAAQAAVLVNVPVN